MILNLCEFPIRSYVKLSTAVQPSWSEGRTTRRNFGKGPFNDYFIKIWFQLSNWFQTRKPLVLNPKAVKCLHTFEIQNTANVVAMDETAIYDYSSVRIEQNIIEYISKFGSN
jgi:hypothetical protein